MINCFIATLSQSLAVNGTETTVYLSGITTLTGETVATAQFSTWGRGVLTVDPLVSTSIEFISFTAVDGTAISVTGATRGLSALSNSVVAANKKYHNVGAQVIISFGIHNVLDIKAYVDGVVSGLNGNASNTTAGVTKITENLSAAPRGMAALVSQQTSPNMTLKVQPFGISVTDKDINFAGGNTGTMVAPVTNPRIDLVVYDTANSVIAVRTGAEGVSPTKPTPTTGDIMLCAVTHVVGETVLKEQSDGTNGYISRWYQPAIYRTDLVTTASYPISAGTDQSQLTQDSLVITGEANLTGRHNKIAQSFVNTHGLIRGATLYKGADTGSFTGTVTIALQADSTGSPSGSTLASVVVTNANWLLIATGTFDFIFTAEYAMTVGAKYWIVISTSTSDNSNHPNIGANSAGGYASGLLKFNNTADGWATYGVSILYFQTLEGIISQIPQSNTQGLLPEPFLPYSFVDMDTVAGSTISNSTTVTTVYTKVLRAGFFKINSGIKVTFYFLATTTTSGTQAYDIVLNGTNVVAGTTMGGAVTNTYNAKVCFYIVNQSALNSQKYNGEIIWLTNFNGTTAQHTTSITQLTGTSAVDTTGEVRLQITMNNTGANGSVQFQYTGSVIEKIG